MVYQSNVVEVGGGTGTYTGLTGLKKYTKPTAVVSMADHGGSTGRLRDRLGVLPPGDIRSCLVALSADNGNNYLRKIFDYRFRGDGKDVSLDGKTLDELLLDGLSTIVGSEGRALAERDKLFNPSEHGSVIVKRLRGYTFERGDKVDGHSLGNLILTALTKITGSYVKAVEIASKVLYINGRVLPVTIDDVELVAIADVGGVRKLIKGEDKIDVVQEGKRIIEGIDLIPDTDIYYEAEQALVDADLVVLGPGDLWTSVLPPMKVGGFPEAVKEAKRRNNARVVYVCNLVTEPGETDDYTAMDHLQKVVEHVGPGIVDTIICNNKSVSPELLEKYAVEGRHPVMIGGDTKELGVELVSGDLIGDEETESQLLRHHPDKLARHILGI